MSPSQPTPPERTPVQELQLLEAAYGSAHYHAALALRQHVLRSPLGLTYTPAQLENDTRDRQFVAMLDEQLVGGVMLHHLSAESAKLRQFAVAPSLQGFGIGSRLLSFFELATLESGYREIHLSARETATAFYRKHGYRSEGDRYLQVGLPHIAMRKDITHGPMRLGASEV